MGASGLRDAIFLELGRPTNSPVHRLTGSPTDREAAICGRYTLRRTAEEVAEAFDADALADLDWSGPRYNIAPTQNALFVRRGEGAGRELAGGRWGLVPFWVDDPEDFPTLINGRSETAPDKPAFRDAFRKRRCLVPADGFYEWQEQNGGPKQPFHCRLEEDRPFAFAGLWERWGEEGEDDYFRSYTILTTDASDPVATVHDRQPVILEPADYDRWMDPSSETSEVRELLEPIEPVGLELRPIGRRVNDPSNDDPRVLEEA